MNETKKSPVPESTATPRPGQVPMAVLSLVALGLAVLSGWGVWVVFQSETLSAMAKLPAAGGIILAYVIVLGCAARVVNRRGH